MFGVVYLEMVFGMVKDKFVNVFGLEFSDVKFFSIFILFEIQVIRKYLYRLNYFLVWWKKVRQKIVLGVFIYFVFFFCF